MPSSRRWLTKSFGQLKIRFDRWLLDRIESKIRAEMPKPKPSDDKSVLLLKKILARLDAMDDLSPELAVEIERTRLLVRKIDRMVPDNPNKKE